jgi:hypothetical protein
MSSACSPASRWWEDTDCIKTRTAHTRFNYVAAQLLHKRPKGSPKPYFRFMFCLQIAKFLEWAMLVSNQRPLPCEVKATISWLFTVVQKYLQNEVFRSIACRVRSPLFVWVGVPNGV